MTGFVDEAVIVVNSGHGGAGKVSFRREKYVPRGGPDGGDGGKGGDVIFLVKPNLKTLYHLKRKHKFQAANGDPGGKRRKHGKDGENVIIPVPPGTYIKDYHTNDILKDLKEPGETWVFLAGGRGGQGNWHFRSARNQTPRFAQPGETGKERQLSVELNLIADIGLVGLPNAGKSTLLSVVTNATPEIAAYPFTTKIPNLGVMHAFERDVIIADIPGIIAGASQGVGLGLRFLKHISRSFLIVLLVDLSSPSVAGDVHTLQEELMNYAPALLQKQKLILGTKMDLADTEENLKILQESFPDVPILGISAVTGKGLQQFRQAILPLITAGDEHS